MPTEKGESVTDDLNDPPTPTTAHFPQPLEEVPSPQTQEETPISSTEANQLEGMQLEQEEETGQSQAGNKCHTIKNVDEIFHTIEGLMSKLRRLKVSLCYGSNKVVGLTVSINSSLILRLKQFSCYLVSKSGSHK